MRGKPSQRILRLSGGRITPADAGKTAMKLKRNANAWDHPRGCGENANHMCIVCLPAGITPADAGKTAR